jgi:hypothetical protein
MHCRRALITYPQRSTTRVTRVVVRVIPVHNMSHSINNVVEYGDKSLNELPHSVILLLLDEICIGQVRYSL